MDDARRCVGSTKLADVVPGQRAKVYGRLKSVRYTPTQNVPTLQAELMDGTGSITLVWLGRRRIAGIEPGRMLEAYGCVADSEDGPVIFNPRYELWA
jgi:RecG-like helicase